ncbi:squalene/phytoene synthase family protein [Pseudogemmobacter faecipullorum]|uniref:Squalene/phytoene synthase family protein n=1 Tax=Pseudogemmobacter faecipullorum TaxID=2755041 RepID=A0ABS8CKV9_9RHOB|nr:squalene/phytoene synthase family protein [Pseudogemmobacter faecipullorum]
MSLDACAALIEKGDPDRFAAILAAPHPARARLLPLYALNLEVARAPWVTKEPMIAEMRLQWWRDVVEKAATGAAPAHEIAAPLSALIREQPELAGPLDQLILARRHDAWKESFETVDDFEAYLDQTGGALAWAAALVLGAPPASEPVVRAHGRAAGLAAYLQAVAELSARGRATLPEQGEAAVMAFAERGLGWLREARAGRRLLPRRAAPALLAGWQSEALLQMALKDPGAVQEGRLQLPELRRKGRLLWQAFTQRW